MLMMQNDIDSLPQAPASQAPSPFAFHFNGTPGAPESECVDNGDRVAQFDDELLLDKLAMVCRFWEEIKPALEEEEISGPYMFELMKCPQSAE